MKYYLKVLRDYANFSGRARRSEYWHFALFSMIFSVVAMIIDHILGTTFKMDSFNDVHVVMPYGYVYLLYSLVVMIPGLAVTVRRLHDVGKSGWFLLICLIPLIGAIWLLVLLFTDSQPGPNQYGPNPKEMEPQVVV
jgi:uncharacterized membrane protein YhaH (DUF805 family)